MIRRLPRLALGLAAAALAALPSLAAAQEVVNVYSSRHYDTDEALYRDFTEKTGIEVKLIEGDADELLARIQSEGELSPADVFVAVDAGRLNLAVEAGVLDEVESDILSEKIPESLRHPDGQWFGISKRVRVILVAPEMEGKVTSYEDLASDAVDGGLLVRSSSNIYNQSLMASIVANSGEEAALAWAEGLVDNFARTPTGGDRDQIRGVAAGEGEVALANHYYYARMLDGDDAADREAAGKVKLVFPNQDGRGAHVNVSGAGVVKNAPNRENAVKFLEYLTTPQAQTYWASDNYEYPVVEGVELPEVLKNFGEFKEDSLNAQQLGDNNRVAVQLMDRAGWR